jgi:hypothetical protein
MVEQLMVPLLSRVVPMALTLNPAMLIDQHAQASHGRTRRALCEQLDYLKQIADLNL